MKWDEVVDSNVVVVGYTDRFVGVVEAEFDKFDWDSNLAAVGPQVLAIPEHRIQYFKYSDEVVWNKARKYDAVFGSVGTTQTIVDVIKSQKEKEEADSLAKRAGDQHMAGCKDGKYRLFLLAYV